MNSLAIIPARWGSSRFPGKPLAILGGIPVVVRTARRAQKATDLAVVATDDLRIMQVCSDYGIQAVMTRNDHQSGTDRINEALDIILSHHENYHISSETDLTVVNVQGDEPFVDVKAIRKLIDIFNDPAVCLGTLYRSFPTDADYKTISNPNVVKLVTDRLGQALYFSRSVIPYIRGAETEEWPRCHRYLQHIGVYAYRPETLRRIAAMPKGELETCESLEQLRWLQSGISIRTVETEALSIGIDTPEDLSRAEEALRSQEEDIIS